MARRKTRKEKKEKAALLPKKHSRAKAGPAAGKQVLSEEMYRRFIDQSAEGIALLEFSPPIPTDLPAADQVRLMYKCGRITLCNRVMAEMYGYDSVEEILGKGLPDLYGSLENEVNFQSNLALVLNGYRALNVETEELNQRGEKVHFLNNAVGIVVEGKLLSVWSVQRDVSELKRVLEALRESEAKYRDLIENIHEVVFTLDSSGTITYLSSSVERVSGYRPQDLMGRNFTELIFSEDLPLIAAHFSELARGITGPDEYRVIKKNGTPHWVYSFSKPIFKEGRFAGVNGIMADIHERKLAQLALQREQELLARIMKTTPVGITMVNREGKITFANDFAEKVLGLTKSEIESRTYDDPKWHITDYDGNPFPKEELPFNRIMRDGQPVFGVRHAIEWDDHRVLLSINAAPLLDAGGKPEGMVAIVLDETQKIAAEKALQESEQKFRTIFDHSNDAIILHDLEGRILDVNQKTLDLFGYSREEIMKLDISRLHPPEALKQSQQAFADIKARETIRIRIDFQKKNGQLFHSEVSSSLYELSGIRVIQGIIRDMTEQIRIQAQLQQAQKMEAIGTLAGGIAHDFNNLLMGIQGRASLILLDIESSHPHYENLKGIEEYVKSAAELTRQLLGLARGGKYELVPMDLNDLIRRSSEMFGRTRKEIKIFTKFKADLWTVEVDRTQVEQVLLNLYINAWQAMPSGGELYINTQNIELKEVDAPMYQVKPGKFVKVSVTDTGIGMDEATKSRIFDPFFTTKEMGRGSGLGLASAYGIVKNHGGVITVYSERGSGSTFNIYLPATEKAISIKSEAAGEPVKGLGTILLIDDEQMILDVAKQLLESLGYKVHAVDNGRSAMEVYEKNHAAIDLVILDMIMPQMSGDKVFDGLKAVNPGVRVLLSSGYSLNGQAQEIMRRGCRGFIQKPFTLKELSEKIREILGK